MFPGSQLWAVCVFFGYPLHIGNDHRQLRPCGATEIDDFAGAVGSFVNLKQKNAEMIYLLAVIAINGLSYLATIYLGNALEPVLWGKIANGISLASTIAVFSSLGRAEYDLREVSLKGEKVEISSIVFSVLLVCLISVFYSVLADAIDGYFLISLGVLTLLEIFFNVPLKVTHSFIQLAMVQRISNAFKIFLWLSFLLFGSINLSITISVFLVIMAAYSVWHLYKFSAYYHFSISKRWFEKGALRFLLNGLSQVVYYQSAILIMGFYGMYAEVATYSLGILLVSGVALVTNAYFNSMSLAAFYKMYAANPSKAMREIREKMVICLLICLGLLVVLIGIVYCLYPLIFNLDKYPELQTLSALFIIPALLKLLYAPCGMMMNLQEWIAYKNKVYLITALSCVVLTLVLVKPFGVYGAFVAFALSELFIMVAFIGQFIKFERTINKGIVED